MCGGGGSTTQLQKFEPPDYTVQGWKDYLGNVTNLAPGIAGAQYTGQTIAPESAQSLASGNMAASLAQYGSPLTSTAYAQLQNTAAGNNVNPYATMGNQYAGDNPYLQQVLDQSNNDITQQFMNGTAAQTDAAAAKGGAFGGSAYQQQQAANGKVLANSLAQNESNVRMGNYNNSAQLQENQLNRATQGYQQDQANALQASMASPAMEAADINAINTSNQYGNQGQAYLQQLLTEQQNKFNQANQAPLTAQDLIRNALQAASGTGGSSSSQTLQNSSGLQNIAGLGALGASIYSGFQ